MGNLEPKWLINVKSVQAFSYTVRFGRITLLSEFIMAKILHLYTLILLLLLYAFAYAGPIIHKQESTDPLTASQLAQRAIANVNNDLDSMAYYAELAGNRGFQQKDPTGILNSWLAKARYYFYQKDSNKTSLYITLLKHYGPQLKNDSILAETYFLCGEVYCLKPAYKNSLISFFKALTITDKINSKTLAAKILCNIGDVYYYLNQFEYALQYYNQAITIAKDTPDEMLTVSFCLSGVADIYRQQNNYSKSIELYKQSLQLAYKTNQIDIAAFNLWGLAMNYIKIEDYAQANYYLNGGIALSKKINGFYRIASCYTAFGKLNNCKRNFAVAQYYFTKSDSIARQLNYTDLIVENSNARSNLYFLQCNYKLAILQAKLTYKFATQEGNNILKKEALIILQKSYEKIGNLKQAYCYHQCYLTFTDNLRKTENLERTSQLQLKIELEKENRDKKRCKTTTLSAAVKYEKLLRNTSIIGVFCLFTLILSVYVYHYFKFRSAPNFLLGLNHKKEITLNN